MRAPTASGAPPAAGDRLGRGDGGSGTDGRAPARHGGTGAGGGDRRRTRRRPAPAATAPDGARRRPADRPGAWRRTTRGAGGDAAAVATALAGLPARSKLTGRARAARRGAAAARRSSRRRSSLAAVRRRAAGGADDAPHLGVAAVAAAAAVASPVASLAASALAAPAAARGRRAARSRRSRRRDDHAHPPRRRADDVVDRRRRHGARSTQTTNLRGRQEIDVTWSRRAPDRRHRRRPELRRRAAGGVPGGAARVPRRRLDHASPADQQLDPETCWTATPSERFQDSCDDAPSRRSGSTATRRRRSAPRSSASPSRVPPTCCCRPTTERTGCRSSAADGTVYAGGPVGCAGMAPEAANVGGSSRCPSNTTYGVTDADGTGSAKFDVWTDEDNASLGCSPTVAVLAGRRPDHGHQLRRRRRRRCRADDRPAGRRRGRRRRAPSARRTGHFAAGSNGRHADGTDDLAVSGALWWTASNWRNRITVPLTSRRRRRLRRRRRAQAGVDVYGSELIDAGDRAVGAALLPGPEAVPLQARRRPASPRPATCSGPAASTRPSRSRPPTAGTRSRSSRRPTAVTGFAIAFADRRRATDSRTRS